MTTELDTDDNRRKDIRSKVTAKVKLMHPSLGEALLTTYDISDGGVFLYTQDTVAPALGETVQIQITGLPSEAPIVTMKVVRKLSKGIGLQFVLEDEN